MCWADKAKYIVETIKKYQADTDGWKQTKKNKDVTIWYKTSPEWNGTLYKSESVVDADPETVFKYIEPIPEGPRSRWDKAIKALECLKVIDQNLSICRTVTHSAIGGLISSRDFVDLVITVREDDMISTNATAVEYADCPKSDAHVRGMNYPCCISCYKIPEDPNKTRVVSYIQTDLAGILPQSVVDNALPSNIVDFYGCLRKALKQDGHLTNGIENGQS